MKPGFSTNLCPSCRKKIPQDASQILLPFCSKRCKMVDLGKWFNEEYSVAASALTEDEIEDEYEHSNDSDKNE